MKKILFLKSDYEPGIKPTYLSDAELLTRLNVQIGETADISLTTLPELIFEIGENTKIFHPELGDIADFDAVIIRKVGRFLELGIAVAHYLQAKEVPFTDKYLLLRGNGKLACALIRSLAGLPVPRTVYGPVSALLSTDMVRFPCVVKADLGHAGQDNFLVHTAAEYRAILANYPHDIMVTQDFIPNDGDYRVLVFGGKVVCVILRQASEGHLNNTSQGGRASIVPLASLPRHLLVLAERAARLDHLQVAGVDIMVDRDTGRAAVIEVNRAPQIASGAFVDEKVALYGRFLEQFVSAKSSKQPTVIGCVEKLTFPDLEGQTISARIDTGAKTSAISAKSHVGTDGKLHVKFLAPELKNVEKRFDEYATTRVASSNGQVELRYKIRLTAKLAGRTIKTFFTLTDRSSQVYPVLVGRNILNKRFIVDVSQGTPDIEAEKRRSNELQNGEIE